jgi:ActR/RegA family two-component response regulator
MAHILVVEDHESTLQTYGLVLRNAGYGVELVTSARSGLERARTRRFDLALIDHGLPDGSAVGLLESLQRVRVVLPVIVVTGDSSLDTAVEAMRRGAIDYAVKPLLGDDLLAKVAWGLQYSGRIHTPRIPPEAYRHAATRWAALVVAVLSAPRDIKTNAAWARLVGVSATTLRDWCRLANTSPARSLALARLARAVYLSRDQAWQPSQRLDTSDPRTLARLLRRGGLPSSGAPMTLQELLARQSLVEDLDALLALRNALARIDEQPSSR